MLTRKFVTIYGIVGLVIMAVLLILFLFKLVPAGYYIPLFILAFVVWVSRLIMRVIVARRERGEAEAGQDLQPPDPGIDQKQP